MSINNLPDKKPFKYLTPFKMQVLTNFPYIEEDFDALTNYELLCKVVEYLRVTIDNVNNLDSDFENLYNAYSELLTYVNNYFDNLDVQEEINNKLDDMVEQGTLQEIIADYLNSKAIFGFDTINDMKQATNLINGSYAKTLGYHSKNDDGSALYKIRTITNDDVVDEMQIIEMADDNLVAEYVNEKGIISPEQMGAYGDGINDDSTILNSVLQIANTKSYKVVGNKTYKTTAPLVITYNDMDISLHTLSYTGVENSIYLKGKRNKLNINTLNSNGVGFYITCSNTETCVNNEINIDYINSEKHGISMFTDSWGIYENYFKFIHIIVNDNTCNGINMISALSTTHTTSYINQNIFYGGRIDGANYSLYADATNGQINEILAYNISGEGSTNGMYLNKVTDSTFDNWRLEELTNESGHLYMKLVGDVKGCQFRFNRFTPIELIDRTLLSNNVNNQNVIYGNIRDTRQGGTLGGQLYFWGTDGLKISNPVFKSKSITGDTTLTQYEFPTFFNISTSVTNATITLNSNYSENAISSFYVFVRSGQSITITNSTGSTSTTITRTQLNQVVIVGSIFMVQ